MGTSGLKDYSGRLRRERQGSRLAIVDSYLRSSPWAGVSGCAELEAVGRSLRGATFVIFPLQPEGTMLPRVGASSVLQCGIAVLILVFAMARPIVAQEG